MPVAVELEIKSLPKPKKASKWAEIDNGQFWKFEAPKDFTDRPTALRSSLRSYARSTGSTLEFEFYADGNDGPARGDKPYALARLVRSGSENGTPVEAHGGGGSGASQE